MNKKIFLFILVVPIFLCKNIFPTVKGSESALSVEAFYTFPQADSDNTMLGFGWFKNGFGLEDSTTTCTFNSVFPVSGNIYLNGGNLRLLADLILCNTASWCTSGFIYGNGHVIDFNTSVTGWGSTIFSQSFDTANVSINNDLIISGSVRFSGDCLFHGNEKRLVLSEDGYLVVDSTSTLVLSDVSVEGITGNNICCIDDTSVIKLCNVSLIQSGDYSFTTGSMLFQEDVYLSGTYTFSYESGQTSTIAANSRLIIDGEKIFSIGRKEATGYVEPLYFTDGTSNLKLNGCTLHVTETGFCLSRGVLSFNHDVNLEVDSSDATNGLGFGTGDPSADITVKFYPSSGVHFCTGHIIVDNINPNFMVLDQGNGRMVRQSGTIVYANEDMVFRNLLMNAESGAQMIIASNKKVSFEACTIYTTSCDFSITGKACANGCYMLEGNGDLYLKRGSLLLETDISGVNNKIRGNGNIDGAISLQDNSSVVSFDLNGVVANDIAMGGGTVVLTSDLSLACDKVLTGSGMVTLASNDLLLGSLDKTWTSSIYWDGFDGHIQMGSSITLMSTWTFSGVCTIEGNGHILQFGDTGEVVVESGSMLILKETKIKNLSGYQIRCVDDTASVIFDSSKITLDDNYTFTTGGLNIIDSLEISGEYTFAYQSAQTSTICSYGTLLIDRGTTFSFDPIYNSGVSDWDMARDFLELEDATASIELKSATLYVTSTGLKLKKGKLRIKELSSVYSDLDGSFHMEEGCILGNNSAADDVRCEIAIGAKLTVQSGALSYKNVSSTSWNMLSDRSKLHIASGAKLKVHQTLDVGEATVCFASGSRLARAQDKKLLGSIHMLGPIYYERCYN